MSEPLVCGSSAGSWHGSQAGHPLVKKCAPPACHYCYKAFPAMPFARLQETPVSNCPTGQREKAPIYSCLFTGRGWGRAFVV